MIKNMIDVMRRNPQLGYYERWIGMLDTNRLTSSTLAQLRCEQMSIPRQPAIERERKKENQDMNQRR